MDIDEGSFFVEVGAADIRYFANFLAIVGLWFRWSGELDG